MPIVHALASGQRRFGLNEYSTNAFYAPSDFPSLTIWIKADEGVYQDAAKTVPCTNGTTVYTWADLKSGFDLIQATAATRPQYVSAAVNGKPALLFNYVNKTCTLNSTHASIGQPFTICWVGQVLETTSALAGPSYCMFFNGDDNGPQVTYSHGDTRASAGPWMFDVTGAPRNFWPSYPFFDNFCYASTVWNGASSLGRVTGIGGACESSPGTWACRNFHLMNDPSNSQCAMHGYMAELCLFNTALTIPDLLNIESYFRDKYALP